MTQLPGEPETDGAAVAIVTGGSRGIGAEIVRRLARAGLHVLLVYGSDDREAAATAERCTTETARVVPFRCDIAAPGAPEAVFDRADRLGTPVVLVNNAGVTGRISALAESDPEGIRRAIDVDLTVTIMLCREAMIRWTGGAEDRARSIVNVSSVAAKTGAPGEYVWYAAAKAGVNALTTGLAVEAAPHGIRVNAVNPGTTDTTIHARAGRSDRAAVVGARSPMGRPAQPDEIAAAVEWLVGSDASYVNGATLDVTGGTR
ncbi:SDR family NAD(P)-dependent oxidoreductase [Leucobacter ruminantium]|uniref:SDR family oxidoreductase n=1 Tax=Leucobacter ruminantium TaxID=1289170 RepID=A0A939LWA5_9MICO|nr:SDR family oxidoreductase [Leucobacter ruminantium]MBO1804118.1 SDR family oxidoreductase [Leucobacter ruminantium]